MRLDSWNRAGLTQAEFRSLFVQCSCGLLMTCRAFRGHTCVQNIGVHTAPTPARAGPVIIDLTLDSDEDSDEDSIIDLTLDENM